MKSIAARIETLERHGAPAPGAEGIAICLQDGTPYDARSAALLAHWRAVGYTPVEVRLTWPTHDIETPGAAA